MEVPVFDVPEEGDEDTGAAGNDGAPGGASDKNTSGAGGDGDSVEPAHGDATEPLAAATAATATPTVTDAAAPAATAAAPHAGSEGDPGGAKPPRMRLPHWASNLEDSVDKQLLVILRDGRTLIGWLRTFDQFANLLLEHVVERHILCQEKLFADVSLGTMLVRGENVCLFGEVDHDRPCEAITEAPLDVVLRREAELEEEALLASGGPRRQLVDLFADPP